MAKKSKTRKFKGKNISISIAELQIDEDEIIESLKKLGKETSKIVKNKAPGTGDYKNGIYNEVKIIKGVYVLKVRAKKYQLSHLLEFGHIAENQYGVYGKVKGQPHFITGQKYIKKEIVKALSEKEIIF